MSFAKTSRKLHRIAALVCFLPLGLVTGTGLLLQVKKQLPWVQPPTLKGTGTTPAVDLEDLLAAARSRPEAGIQSFDDLDRIEIQPSRGLAKLRGKNRFEVQVDTGTGEVLQVAYRRSDLIESLHDGSFFGEASKLGIFLTSGLCLLFLWASGLHLWLLPHLNRWRARRQRSSSH